MSAELNRTGFLQATVAQREAARGEAAAARAAAAAALATARSVFSDAATERYASGAPAATLDADRLEALATRLVAFLDAVEPGFQRLDVARDAWDWRAAGGRCVVRTIWNRERLAALLAESFEDLLSPPALAVLAAACRCEALA